MPTAAAIITDQFEVQQWLERMGIPIEVPVRAAQLGFVERGLALPYDPVTAAGWDAWRYTVRSLRMDLEGPEWRMDDPQNLPLMINDTRRINLTVSSGDEATGTPATPKSKNPKGTLLEEAVLRNIKQGHLFPELLSEAELRFGDTASYPTWVFLVFITDEVIRAEISLPSSVGVDERLDDWRYRLILDVPLPDSEKRSDRDDDQGPDILPSVTPKI